MIGDDGMNWRERWRALPRQRRLLAALMVAVGIGMIAAAFMGGRGNVQRIADVLFAVAMFAFAGANYLDYRARRRGQNTL